MSADEEHDEAERFYLRIRRRLPPGGEDELNELGAGLVFAVVAVVLWGVAIALGTADLGPVIVGFFAVMYVLYLAIDYSYAT
ncbi:hypothetical protein [Halorarum salinum]|uniref:Uncharacterized protein n=1 Tax=Halorarum salinum TaxID=2743089 RepID=A0A7D5QCN5_9EURY|nr:hypothetical protein [Halobaculum salinum]QLG62700.1 hypothetical protein HUG12_13575 [Halobaculum salinum]